MTIFAEISILLLLYSKFFIIINTYYSGKDSFIKFTNVPKVNDIKNNPIKNIKYDTILPYTVFGVKSPYPTVVNVAPTNQNALIYNVKSRAFKL